MFGLRLHYTQAASITLIKLSYLEFTFLREENVNNIYGIYEHIAILFSMDLKLVTKGVVFKMLNILFINYILIYKNKIKHTLDLLIR